jgi:prepilin-type N-terminal cleavage/methylation domain-containing protein
MESTSLKIMKTDHQAPARGFTIIEMLVVLAIITLLLGVVLSSQSIFNRTLLLTDTAYTVALSVRQTQSLGLSGRENSGLTNVGYGIHLASNGSNPITSFTQFAYKSSLSREFK